MASQYTSLASPGVRRPARFSKRNPVARSGRSQTAVVDAITYTPPLWKKMKRFVMRGLTTKERLLLTLRYGEQLTFAEIAVVLEMPETRVAELHRNVAQRVRKWVLGERKNRTQVA